MGSGEDALQAAVAELLDMAGWCWCHVPNEGKRRAAWARKLARHGLKPGVPDVLIFERWLKIRQGECYFTVGHGIAIELKHGKGRLTKAQKAWLADLEARGWLTAVCRSVDEVLDVLRVCRPRNGRPLPGR
jgi:hypothetical protein